MDSYLQFMETWPVFGPVLSLIIVIIMFATIEIAAERLTRRG